MGEVAFDRFYRYDDLTKILRCASRPVDPAWLEDELAELERLVDVGETVEVVARLSEMVRAPRRLGATATQPAAQREPVSREPV